MTMLRRLAATAALALAALGVSVPAASAGSDQVIETKRGYVLFIDEGEIIRAADTLRDGKGVRLYVMTPYTSGPVYSVADRGAGGRFADENLSLREGTAVEIQLCYINRAGEDTKCSAVQEAEA